MEGDFLIKDWLIQPQTNMVEKGSQRWRVEPKVMQVLVQLASHTNQVLSKERLMDAVWSGTFVGDDVLIRCISEIRHVFGDDARSPSIIQTIPKSGYRLIAPVEMVATELVGASREQKVQQLYEDAAPVAVSPASVLEEPIFAEAEETQAVPLPEPVQPEAVHHGTNSLHPSRHWKALLALGAILIAAVPGSVFAWTQLHPDPFTVLWKPVLDSPEPVLLSIADQGQYSTIKLHDSNDSNREVVLKEDLSAVTIDDMKTITQVAATLRSHGKNYLLKGEGKNTLSDLRTGPTVFIGSFSNAWTLYLTRPLRFHFTNDADMTHLRIVDASNPSAPGWGIDRVQQLAKNYVDYAIVARFVDTNTGKPAIIVAGIGRGANICAGEFLTEPEHVAELVRVIKSNGNKPNFEVVLSTQIIDGHAGAPHIQAAHFW